ncbi:Cobalt-zinc-cadmium resistance protein CzcA [Moraxella catarrhalis RH4]|nr:Cobalt-zinc-cadmium resistance protein CzcA [Moraxella catarrhalis RH4]
MPFFTLMMILGIYGFLQMKIQQFPDIDLPGVVTTITLAGASPDQLENDVAKKVENKLANIEGVKSIRTTLQTGAVTIFTVFELEKPNDEHLTMCVQLSAKFKGNYLLLPICPSSQKSLQQGFLWRHIRLLCRA